MAQPILDDARNIAGQLVAWRRHLHAHPELSGQEENTARFIAERLRELGYEPREKIGGAHGLTATLRAGDGPMLALRADFDALPIQEETGVDYASTNPGVMHACGHDAHTAMLLGAAAILKDRKDQLKRPVKFVFQPAEERFPGGAAPMIEAGVLDEVESIFGIHIASQLPPGCLGTRPGPFMSSVNDLEITVHGKGGHAAMPEQCIDPIVVAAQIILALQTVASRSIAVTDAAVVSVTMIDGGTADNIIPNDVRMRGTIRTLDEAVRAVVCQRVRELAEGVARTFGAEAEVKLKAGYPVLENDAAQVEHVLEVARRLGFPEQKLLTITPLGGGEDFAYFLQKTPGAFVFLGAGNDAKDCTFPHHHSRFNIDEDVLPWGAALHAQMALSAGVN